MSSARADGAEDDKNLGRFYAMAINQRVQQATTRAIESCNRVTRIAENTIEEIDDITPIYGVPIELDDEDSAVIAVKEVMSAAPGSQSAAGPTSSPKRRARTEPGGY